MTTRKLSVALGICALAAPSAAGASTGGVEPKPDPVSSFGEDVRSYVVAAKHNRSFSLGDVPLGAWEELEVLIDGRSREIVTEDGFGWALADSTYVELEPAMKGAVSVFERAYHGKHRVTVIVRWSA